MWYRWLLQMWQRHPGWQWPLVWLTQPKFLIGVAAVVVNDEAEVLLFRHTYRRLAWGLPSGWMHYGERAEDAIAREIWEEGGFALGSVSLLTVASGFRHPRIDVVFLGHLPKSAINSFRPSAEVDDARFFPVDGLPPLLASQRALIQMACPKETAAAGSEAGNLPGTR